jgi:hypothetical protein
MAAAVLSTSLGAKSPNGGLEAVKSVSGEVFGPPVKCQAGFFFLHIFWCRRLL